MDLATFAHFSTLATELRLKIWAYACTPRIVSLRYLPESDTIQSATTVPAILHVSRESRYEALRVYSLSFGTKSSPARTYFSPDLDTVYMPRYRRMGYDETLRDFKSFLACPEELDRVRWLALDYVKGSEKRPWEAYDKACLIRGFAALEELLVVLGRNRWNEAQGACARAVRRAQIARAKAIEFGPPSESPEEILGFWNEFREAWVREENSRKEVIEMSKGIYEESHLPPVRIVAMLNAS